MTMDIASTQNHGPELIKMPSTKMSEEHHSIKSTDITSTITSTTGHIKNSNKRSFDVAFLMLPDEKFKLKQHLEKQPRIEEDIDVISFDDTIPIRNFSQHLQNQKLIEQEQEILKQARFNIVNHQSRSPRIYDDPTILAASNDKNEIIDVDVDMPRSAFTKVPNSRNNSPMPPSSPDQISCPSNSPPISLSPPRNIYQNIRPEYFGGAFQPLQNVPTNKMKQFVYRPPTTLSNPDIPHGYITTTSFPFNTNGHHFSPQSDLSGIVRHPAAAAAILSTLIPPAIATTFSLTAQNVCAKCNINFRMTSDLVYHMRSHHKNDMCNDFARRKREEKLKCPVCNESFRERHHLTRHMTAHQDKAGDDTEGLTVLSRRHLQHQKP